MRSLEGENKIAFDAFMTQLGNSYGLIEEHEERICELEGFARDDANRIGELEEALDNTLCLKNSIEKTSTLDLSKMMGDRDQALCKLKGMKMITL